MAWLFGKKDAKAKPILAGSLPRDEERLGPPPPPVRTPHPPRVALWRAGPSPPGASRVVEVAPGERLALGTPERPAASCLVVSGALAEESGERALAVRVGDLLFGAPLALVNRNAEAAVLLVDERAVRAASPAPPRRLGREELAGEGVRGITGLRALRRAPEGASLRLGPPPGARWVLVGTRGLAVFAGKLTLIDGEEAVVVRTGEIALVGDPTATLYVQAGNDAALALGFAAPDFVAALG